MKRWLLTTIIVLSIILLGYSTYRTQNRYAEGGRMVVVYDQLSSVMSTIDFREEMSEIAFKMGYSSRYYGGGNVSVGLLKDTPRASIVVLRMHSGVFENQVWVFTGEEYSASRNVMDQISGYVHMARCSSTSEVVFAVGEEFIEEHWRELEGCLVILMGCEGLGDRGLAEVFVQKGAAGVVGWNRPVSIDESDEATIELVSLIIEGKTLRDAIDLVNNDGTLRYYPEKAGSFRFLR